MKYLKVLIFLTDAYERCGNGKGEYKNRGKQKNP
jgi:hypothetical protein